MNSLRGLILGGCVAGVVCGGPADGAPQTVIQNLHLATDPSIINWQWTGNSWALPRHGLDGNVLVASVHEDDTPGPSDTPIQYGMRRISSAGAISWDAFQFTGNSIHDDQYHRIRTHSLTAGDDGHVLFIAQKDGFPDHERIWTRTPDGTTHSFEFPVIEGNVYDEFQGAAVAEGGRGIMRLSDGLFGFDANGSTSQIAHSGQQAAGLAAGVTFDAPGENFFWNSLVVNGSGKGAFFSSTVNPDASDGPTGIWRFGVGGTELLVADNYPVDGLEPEERILLGTGSSVAISEQGSVAWAGDIYGKTDESRVGFGIWSDRSGAMDLIVRPGDAAPGRGPGSTFTDAGLPIMNDSGDIGFWGDISTSSERGASGFERGLFVSPSDGKLESVYITGDTVEGIGAGITTGFSASLTGGASAFYTDDDQIATNMAMNNSRQFAFEVELEGPGIIEDVNHIALIGRDTDGTLRKLIQTGDLVEWELMAYSNDIPQVYEFPVLSIEFLGASSGAGGRGTALSDDGWIVYKVVLDDDGFLGNDYRPELILRSRIPSPGTGVMLAMSGGIFATRRRRHLGR